MTIDNRHWKDETIDNRHWKDETEKAGVHNGRRDDAIVMDGGRKQATTSVSMIYGRQGKQEWNCFGTGKEGVKDLHSWTPSYTHE